MSTIESPQQSNAKRDIANREDLRLIVQTFYEHAFEDAQIGYFFTEVAHMDLAAHIPVLTDFWESLLFRTQNYSGNVMQKHLDLHAKAAMEPADFARWMELFLKVIDDLFAGPRADELKHRAKNIAIAIERRLHKPQRAIPLSGKRG